MSIETKVRLYIHKAWGSSDPTRFPGPQPVSIERRHFPLLKKQPYFVCEKTDGVRHFLVSTEDGFVALVNRAFNTEVVKMRVPKDTLLDGELVTTKAGRSPDVLFMVYDAVCVKGEDVMDKPLSERLEAARKLVKSIIKTAGAPFEIRVKNMRLLGDETVQDLDSFEYETDGLVFTPVNEPVRMGTHETMFKWKPHDRITIDFRIKNGNELYVQDRGELFREATLHLRNRKPELPDGTIVECGYGDLGWFVEKVRTDKTYPNNRRTYFRTLVNLREAIKLEELTTGQVGTTPGKTLP
jgi:mRNA capping enzyme, catalytic domain/mRNA capping enzyme, C-terminal domain